MYKTQIRIVDFFDIQMCRKNRNCLFIFGDNEEKWGNGGQAIIRDEPNSFGIPTKKRPFQTPDSYWNDFEYERNRKIIDKYFGFLECEIRKGKYKYIIFPKDGLGTGLAALPKKAPRTFQYLNNRIKSLMDEYRSIH